MRDSGQLVVNGRIRIPTAEIRFVYSRSGGPGGQNVNKVNSRVQLRWAFENSTALPADVRERFAKRYHRQISADGDLCLTSQRFRDQSRNVDDVLEKLASMIRDVATPPKKRIATKVSKGQKQRRLENKRRQSEKKQGRQSMG
jgi:ribosome-associated protein